MNLTPIAREPAGAAIAAASVVHDLRNPLTAIHASAEMLVHSTLTDVQVRRIGRNMYGASVRMKKLLDEFLSRYKGTGTGLECCDLRDLASAAVAEIALVAESQSVEIVQEIPANLRLNLDRQRMRQVFVNLFVNALDVMPNGGTLRISALAGRQCVVIKVRDTGPGIASEIGGVLFEPFVTAGKTHGLGLGLTLSRQAVIAHGGEMWTEPIPQGACFAFSLPHTGEIYNLGLECDPY
jgi:signal transduction histidine kinase